MRGNNARAAEERAVAAEREQRVELGRVLESTAAVGEVVQAALVPELEAECRRKLAERAEHRGKARVAKVSDDA
jgi:hypothetical protein